MEWNSLLSTARYGAAIASHEDQRSTFQRDFDRIVFSASFRRLQDKTQVHPFPDSDYIRRRLTHSLEVSCVGRSLGTSLGKFVQKNSSGSPDAIPEIVANIGQVAANACLAHDIGNPPCGHAGEQAIGEWFRENGTDTFFKITPEERLDLEHFEGNAQGFRILTRLEENNGDGGLRLTAATLASFAKYPCGSRTVTREGSYVGSKKNGLFQSDLDSFQAVAMKVGLAQDANSWRRHPIVFLVEAADDICYKIIDIEDAFRVGRFSFLEARDYLKALVGPRWTDYTGNDDDLGNIGWLRAQAIGNMIEEVEHVVRECYPSLMDGSKNTSLMDDVKSRDAIRSAHEAVKDKVFSWDRTVAAEIAGGRMITDILSESVGAAANPSKTSSK